MPGTSADVKHERHGETSSSRDGTSPHRSRENSSPGGIAVQKNAAGRTGGNATARASS